MSERVVGQVLDTLRAVTAAQPPAEELIHAGVDAYLALLEREPELYRFVARHPLLGPDEQPADFASVVAELLGEQLAAHLRRGGLDPSYSHPWGEAIVGFINAASLWWLDHPDAMTRVSSATTCPRCCGAAPRGYTSWRASPPTRARRPASSRRLHDLTRGRAA